jgi:serine/threonine protein kinase
MCPRCLLRLGLGLEGDEAPAPSSRPPRTDAPYRILTLLGSGPHGRVYLAEHEGLERRLVVVKFVEMRCDAEEGRRRMDRALGRVPRLAHPGVIPVLDAGMTDDGHAYIVSAYHPSTPVTRHCARAGLAQASRLELFALTCDAVQHAHDAGVVHGHLVANNILVPAKLSGVVRVADFGCAALAGEQVDVASDVNALGRLLMDMLPAGERPAVMAEIDQEVADTAAALARGARRIASRRA